MQTIKLSHKIELFVPRTNLANGWARELANRLGGATAIPANGYWLDPNAKLVDEPITVVFANYGDDDTLTAQSIANEFAKTLLAIGENTAAYAIDGVLHLVSE